MNYTEEEQAFIKTIFEKTRQKFDHVPLIEDDEDVHRALTLHRTAPQHAFITTEIYAKLGFDSTGRHTLEERKRMDQEKRYEREMALAKMGQDRLARIQKHEDILAQRKKEILEMPNKVKKDLALDLQQLVEQSKAEIERTQITAIAEVNRVLEEYYAELDDKMIEEKQKVQRQFETRKNMRLASLQQAIEDSTKDLEDTFEAMLLESQKTPIEKQLEAELEETAADYEQYTKRELMDILDKKGVQYNARAVKAELIELVKE